MWWFLCGDLKFSDSNLNYSNSVFDVFISPSRTFICMCGSNIKALYPTNSPLNFFIYAFIPLWSNWISCECFASLISLPPGINQNFSNSYLKRIYYSSSLSCLLVHFWQSNSMVTIFNHASCNDPLHFKRLHLDLLGCWKNCMDDNAPELWGVYPRLMMLPI